MTQRLPRSEMRPSIRARVPATTSIELENSGIADPTITVPCMDGWYMQWYVKVPSVSNVLLQLVPAIISPELNEGVTPVSLVTE